MRHDELAERLTRALLDLEPDLDVARTGDNELFLKLPNGSSSHVFLDNLASRLEGEDRPHVIGQFARASLEALERMDSEPSLSDLVPLVRDLDAYVRTTAQRLDKSEDEVREGIAHVPFAGPLSIVFGFDGVETMRTAGAKEVAAFGLAREALLERAIENLRRKLTEIRQHGDVSHLCMYTAGGNYEASLLLDGNVWQSELDRVQGTLLAFVPARDLLFFVDSANTPAVSKALRIALDAFEEGTYPISPAPLAWNGTRWEPYGGELPEPAPPSESPEAGSSTPEPSPAAARRSGWLASIVPYLVMAAGVAWQATVLTQFEPGLDTFSKLIPGAPVVLAVMTHQAEPSGRRFALHLLGLGLYLAALATCGTLVLLDHVPLGDWNVNRGLAIVGALGALYALWTAFQARKNVVAIR